MKEKATKRGIAGTSTKNFRAIVNRTPAQLAVLHFAGQKRKLSGVYGILRNFASPEGGYSPAVRAYCTTAQLAIECALEALEEEKPPRVTPPRKHEARPSLLKQQKLVASAPKLHIPTGRKIIP